VGFRNNTPSGDDNPTSESVRFRYSTAVADPAWMACSYGGGAQSCTSTGVAVAINAEYLLRVDCRTLATGCKFYINGSLALVKTTNLPATTSTTTGVALASWHFTNTNNTVKTMSLNRCVLSKKP
jgi:hypothetical protein